ncbi:putative ribonuclease H-like domain-containing protein [Tanacetum coccineum]
MAGSDDDIPPPPPPQTQTPTQQTPHTVSTIKLPILKKGEYDIWAMKMEHYLAHTDYPIWEVIQRGNGPVSVSTDTNGVIKVLPPKTAEEILARERERKARTTLLMALPEDHLAKFHKMTDAREMWEAIKSRFGGNDESKKMQKYILKQQFEGFSVSNSEGLHKGYDRFQSLLSQLEIHGAGVSTEDANQKFLRSLPSAWSQVSLIMRTKPGVDSLSFDDLYNNLRVFESNVKGSIASSSSMQNVAFVSKNTSITNDVSTAYGVSNSSGHKSQCKNTSSYFFLANQSSCPQLDHEDLQQLDEFDLEEMDLKWQVAMISMRMKKFYKKIGRKLQFDAKELVGFDKTKVECYNCHKTGHFARECRSEENQDSRRRDAWNTRNKDKDNRRRSGKQEESKALVTLDGEGVDWNSHSEDEQENYALMAYSSSGSDTEIQAYTQALKKVEAQLVAHQQNQLWYEEKIRFMKIDLDDKTDVLTYHKKLLAEAEKEKEELKAKVEKWHNSSKSLNILLNSQMSARDKVGLGYGDQMNKGVLSYENEVFGSLFDSRSSDIEDSLVNNRYVEGMHAVPPPMTGIYIPFRPDKELDDSQFTYGLKQSKPSESNARSSDFTSYESNSSEETHESMPKSVVNEPKVVSQPKVWTNAPIIKEYESDSDDEHVSLPSKEQETPGFANTIKHDYPQRALKNKGIVYSGCSRHMTRNKAYLAEYHDYNGDPITFGVDVDESNKWHRRLGHVNFKNLNKLVKGNLVRGLPSKIFQNDHTCVACQKGKQHKASCKAKIVSSISQPLQLLHMDLFGPTSVRSINHKTYCLVITDDFSRFSWVFFLRTKDETSGILKDFIRQIENQLNQKVKTIRCDNGTEFKNRDIIEFCGSKGIKREYSNARTPQQNGVAERKNRTLIEAARTMLADSFLPNTFWAEAVSTACYVLNRVLVTKPQNKTPYELITGKIPIISYIRPFGCHVTILNTIDHLGKFEGKSDEGFLVGYSLNSKAFRVYNLETKRVEENLHINFLENKPNIAGKGPNWLFDLDYLTDSMNYQPVRSENQANKPAGLEEANHSAGTQDNVDAGNSKMEADPAQDYFTNEEPVNQEDQAFLKELETLKSQEKEANDAGEVLRKEFAQSTEDLLLQAGAARATSTNTVNIVSTPLSTANPSNVFSTGGPSYPNLTNYADQDDSQIPALEDIYGNSNDGIFTNVSCDDEDTEGDFTNLESTVNVSPIPTSRIHSIHPTTQILGDPKLAVQTRSKVNKSSEAYAFISYIQKQRRNNHKDFQHCLFACFLSQIEPKKISQALEDES